MDIIYVRCSSQPSVYLFVLTLMLHCGSRGPAAAAAWCWK